MKSLDIDTASTNLTADSSRRVTIEFTGGMQSGRMYQGNVQSVTVPYSSFAQKLKYIQRLGGKITNISIHTFQLSHPAIAAQEVAIVEPVSESHEVMAEAEPIVLESIVAEEVSEVQSVLEAEITTVIPESIIANDAPPEIIADLKSEPVEVYLDPIAVIEEVYEVIEPVVAEVELEAVSVAEAEVIAEVIAVPEPVVTEVAEVAEIKFENVAVTEEVSEVIVAPEPLVVEVAEVKLESVTEVVNTPEPLVVKNEVICEPVHEIASELELPVTIPATKKKKAATETGAKAKKPRSSSKSSQGFSKRVKHQEDKLVTVSEAINLPHLQDEPLVEEVSEHLSVNIASENLVTEPLITEPLVTKSLVTEPLVTKSLVTESLVTESLGHEVNEPVATIDLPVVPASRKKKSATASTASEVKPQKTKSSAKSSQRLSKKENPQEVATPIDHIDIAIPETSAEVISVDAVVQELPESQPIKIEPEIAVKHEEIITTDLITEVTPAPEMHLPEVPSIVVEPSVPLTPEVVIEPEVLTVKTKKTKASNKGGGFNKPKKSSPKV